MDSSDSGSSVEYENSFESGSDSDADISSMDIRDTDELNSNWQRISTTAPKPAPSHFLFLSTPGCTFNADNFVVLDYFQLFFDDDLIHTLVTETNRYAEQQPKRSSDVLQLVSVQEMQIIHI
ncbi:hypothetical protein QE152_g31161 [Popillia japonica]|uniref:PiggyBac transposable element-derived protein domain-containing protein n=1 Tax=Popillia japonica TaxID=7064 RepID=A0AAW1JC13_POPJA